MKIFKGRNSITKFKIEGGTTIHIFELESRTYQTYQWNKWYSISDATVHILPLLFA